MGNELDALGVPAEGAEGDSLEERGEENFDAQPEESEADAAEVPEEAPEDEEDVAEAPEEGAETSEASVDYEALVEYLETTNLHLENISNISVVNMAGIYLLIGVVLSLIFSRYFRT